MLPNPSSETLKVGLNLKFINQDWNVIEEQMRVGVGGRRGVMSARGSEREMSSTRFINSSSSNITVDHNFRIAITLY